MVNDVKNQKGDRVESTDKKLSQKSTEKRKRSTHLWFFLSCKGAWGISIAVVYMTMGLLAVQPSTIFVCYLSALVWLVGAGNTMGFFYFFLLSLCWCDLAMSV